MNGLTEKTEFKALITVAQTLLFFWRLYGKCISAGDAVRLRHAEKIVKDVIMGNGYEIIYKNNSIGLKETKENRP